MSSLNTSQSRDKTHQFTIHPATPIDADAIATLYLTTRKQLLPFAPLAHSDDEVRQWFANHLLVHLQVMVAVIDEEIVGFCATENDGQFGWIDQLYLSLNHLGQGIGTALLNDALRDLRLPVRLYTFQANVGARRFYERHGFVAIQFGDGSGNEERTPDVLYERAC